MDPDRRRLLRLAGLGAFSLVGGGALAARLLDSRSDGPSSPPATPGTTTSTARAPSSTETTSEPTTTTAGTSPEPDAGVTLLCRDAWGAEPPTRSVAPHEVRGIMVHHSAVVLDDNQNAPERLRSHQSFHQSSGFADLAYHVVIDGRGHVYEGRDPATPGETFTEYDPEGWYLVTCEGNFDAQPFPDAQRRSLEQVLAWAAVEFAVDPAAIRAHSDVAPTACPGDAVEAVFADGSLVDGIRVLVGGGLSMRRLCGADGRERIEAIESGAA